jgi:hypothetical protein
MRLDDADDQGLTVLYGKSQMNAYIKKLIKDLLLRSDAGKKWLVCRNLYPYLDEIGWFKSVEKGLPIDGDGNCLPWFTYASISFLNGKIQSGMTVFEFGSGNSTLWWSRKVFSVVSYEHDYEWFSFLKGSIPSNVKYRHCDLEYGGEYCKAILEYNDKFDIIVIDGRDRVNCAKNSLGALRGNGVIIWDNSEREKYQEGYLYLKQNGFRRLDFEGHGPVNPYKWCTSIFYRSNNCFGI